MHQPQVLDSLLPSLYEFSFHLIGLILLILIHMFILLIQILNRKIKYICKTNEYNNIIYINTSDLRDVYCTCNLLVTSSKSYLLLRLLTFLVVFITINDNNNKGISANISANTILIQYSFKFLKYLITLPFHSKNCIVNLYYTVK